MNPNDPVCPDFLAAQYPQFLYCYLDNDGKLTLSTTEPAGQWALYKSGEYRAAPSNYYKLASDDNYRIIYSREFDQMFWQRPIQFYARINANGGYVFT
jgi:hypothetical protein